MSAVLTEEYNVMVNNKELAPQNIWRYRRGVVQTDVFITGFELFKRREMKGWGV